MKTLAINESALTLRQPIDDGPKRPQYGPRMDENWFAAESAGVVSSASVTIVPTWWRDPALTLPAPSAEHETTWFGFRVVSTHVPPGLMGGVAEAPGWHFKRELEEDDGG